MADRTRPTRQLPSHPDIEQLRRQAKELREAYLAGREDAVREVEAHYRDPDPAHFALHDAQLALARAYGFAGWTKLKAYVDGVTVRRLADAVRGNDPAQVRSLLRSRPELVNMDMAEDDEHRAVHYAVLDRSVEMVRLLMRHGADARKGIWPNREATSALTIARERGYGDIVAAIEEEEARRPGLPGQGDMQSGFALDQAMQDLLQSGDEARIIAVLESQPALMQTRHHLMTPLHAAAAMLWPDVLVWLLDHGADVNARVDNGPSPLEIVGNGAWPKNPSPDRAAAVASILRARGAELSARAAVTYGEEHALREMHARGALRSELPPNQGRRGLLEIAVVSRRQDMLKLLLELGLDPDEPVYDPDGTEHSRGGPLRAGTESGQREAADLLLRAGAVLTPQAAVLLGNKDWLKARHSEGTLANPIGEQGGLLSLAVRHDMPDMLAFLLDLGLDPDERVRLENLDPAVYSSGGPLHLCATEGRLEMARMLLERGANPNAEVYASGSCFFRAYQGGNRPLVELLERYGGSLDPMSAAYFGEAAAVERLFRGEAAGSLPAGAVPEGMSLAAAFVWGAAAGGQPEILRGVLARIDWPRSDPRWHWPLWQALTCDEGVERGLACYRLLLERADPDTSKFGRTLLHDAVGSGKRVHEKARLPFIELLLTAGARLDLRDDLLKSTPLGWACRWGRLEVVKLLLAKGADPVEPDAEPWASPRAWAEKMGHAEVLALLGG